MEKLDKPDTATWTLEPGEIAEEPRHRRRDALAAIGATVLGAIGAVVLRPAESAACRRETGRTDHDPSDGVRHGHTGVNDHDNGDEAGCGSRHHSGCTDSDNGPNADGSGNGRNCRPTGCTDRDAGPRADGPGHGRHCR